MFSFLLERNNDLSNFFWPIIYYSKNHLYKDHSLPFWNTYMLSGTPLLPDPQSPLFYPPNLIFLLFPIDTGLIILIFLHLLIGAFGVYLVCQSLKFKKTTSFFCCLLFLISPKIAEVLEAGHLGLLYSFCLIPYALLATIKLSQKPKLKWLLTYIFSLSLIFLNHPITFALVTVSTMIIFIILQSRRTFFYHAKFLALGLILISGLIAVELIPQLIWTKETNRYLLLQVRDTYPKWSGLREFLSFTFFPWQNPLKIFQQGNSEKVLFLGLAPMLLSIIGFLNLRRNFKIVLIVVLAFVLLISLNNISPIFNLLIKIDWFALMRVATRVWIIPMFAVIFLAGVGIEALVKRNLKFLTAVLVVTSLIELTLASTLRLTKPINPGSYLPTAGINFLKSDPEIFRVFCLTDCISAKQAVTDNLELVEGYSTLIQKNYYQESWQLTGRYWNYYSLSIPPIGTYTFEKLNPDVTTLGEYNTKYLIAPYHLTDPNLELKQNDHGFFVYQNKLFQPKANYPILIYTPNFIRINTTKNQGKLFISLVYNPDWHAFLNGNELTNIQERPNALTQVNLKPNTKFVDLQYQPNSFRVGVLMTGITLLYLILLLTYNLIRKSGN